MPTWGAVVAGTELGRAPLYVGSPDLSSSMWPALCPGCITVITQITQITGSRLSAAAHAQRQRDMRPAQSDYTRTGNKCPVARERCKLYHPLVFSFPPYYFS